MWLLMCLHFFGYLAVFENYYKRVTFAVNTPIL